ncbi:MAG: hypothetical protein NTW86_06890, partial [Candidatus Sumerlaeota bacterium]|nr:hypothetical protein [Candidatus Sumerlaeota bacterium]
MIGRLGGSLVLTVAVALSFSLSTPSPWGAAAKPKTSAGEKAGAAKSKSGEAQSKSGAAKSKSDTPALWSPKVPAEGQSAMSWPGLGLAGQIAPFAEGGKAARELDWRPVTAPGLKASAPDNARTECDLLDGWTFIPIGMDTGQPEKPRATSLPERWPDQRDYVAGWYVRQVPLTSPGGGRLVIRFEQVPLFCVLYVNGVECGRHLGAYTP